MAMPIAQAKPGSIKAPLRLTKVTQSSHGDILQRRDGIKEISEYYDQDLIKPLIELQLGSDYGADRSLDQKLTLIFTTGLSDTVVTTNPCGLLGNCTEGYHPELSSTYFDLGYVYSYVYENTTINGTYFMDTATLPADPYKASDMDVVVEAQPLVLVGPSNTPYFISDQYRTDQETDNHIAVGLFGAGLEPSTYLGLSQNMTFMPIPQVLYQLGYLNEGIFSVYLGDNLGEYGSVVFGGRHLDRSLSRYIDIPLLPTTDSSGRATYDQWSVRFNSLSVIGDNTSFKTLPNTTTTEPRMLIDPGTNFFYIKYENYEAIKGYLVEQNLVQVQNADSPSGQEILYVTNLDALSNFKYQVNFDASSSTTDDHSIQVALSDICITYLDDPDYCILLLFPAPEDSPSEYIVGNAFLRKFFTVFDFINHQISFTSADSYNNY